jgi:hypothetical protein
MNVRIALGRTRSLDLRRNPKKTYQIKKWLRKRSAATNAGNLHDQRNLRESGPEQLLIVFVVSAVTRDGLSSL